MRLNARVATIAASLIVLCIAAVPALAARQMTHGATGSWPSANGDLSSTRANGRATFDAGAVRVLWRFRLPRRANPFGAITSNPVIARGIVYVLEKDGALAIFIGIDYKAPPSDDAELEGVIASTQFGP